MPDFRLSATPSGVPGIENANLVPGPSLGVAHKCVVPLDNAAADRQAHRYFCALGGVETSRSMPEPRGLMPAGLTCFRCSLCRSGLTIRIALSPLPNSPLMEESNTRYSPYPGAHVRLERNHLPSWLLLRSAPSQKHAPFHRQTSIVLWYWFGDLRPGTSRAGSMIFFTLAACRISNCRTHNRRLHASAAATRRRCRCSRS